MSLRLLIKLVSNHDMHIRAQWGEIDYYIAFEFYMTFEIDFCYTGSKNPVQID